MGTDEYFEAMTDFALKDYTARSMDELDELRRQIEAALRAVERDTRHKLTELIQECASKAMNTHPSSI